MVELSSLRDRLPRRRRDRIAVDGTEAWKPVAGTFALQKEGRISSEASRVPKGEAPGATTIVVERSAWHPGHPPNRQRNEDHQTLKQGVMH